MRAIFASRLHVRAFPVAKRLSIEYHTHARYGDELDIATWVMDTNGSGVFRGYRLKADGKEHRAFAGHVGSYGPDADEVDQNEPGHALYCAVGSGGDGVHAGGLRAARVREGLARD